MSEISKSSNPLGRIGDILISETIVITAILLNAIALAIEHSTFTAEQTVKYWGYIDYGCTLYFLTEVIIKLKRYGWTKYWDNGWNKFDFTIVVASAPMLLSPIMDMGNLGAILVLRLGRLFRLLRLLRFIPNQEKLIAGLRRAMKTSVGVVLALTLLGVILGMGANVMFGKLAPEYFGDPFIAFYSIFQVFTIEGWYELPATLAERADSAAMGTLARFYFGGTVLLGGIIGLSLANAVFVDEMASDNNDEIEAKIDAIHEELKALRAEMSNRNQS